MLRPVPPPAPTCCGPRFVPLGPVWCGPGAARRCAVREGVLGESAGLGAGERSTAQRSGAAAGCL